MTDFAQTLTHELDGLLRSDDLLLERRYPGGAPARQPLHTVYVPADEYTRDLPERWGARALDALDAHGSDLGRLARLLDLDAGTLEELMPRVRRKLEADPIEDLRIDFEDGYGNRSDAEEDAAVDSAAAELLAAVEGPGPGPGSFGIRFKSLERPTRARGIRTLVRWADRLAGTQAGGRGLLVTLPKVLSVAQVEAMVRACEALESKHGTALGPIRFEVQVETPQSVLGADGTALVARMIHASEGRCTGLHFGTYDYSAACGIAAEHQSMDHPAADHAKAVMQAAAAGTGVLLSDGSTNIVPAGSEEQVHRAWAVHARLVRRAFERGYSQGWDLHPAQLPTRYLMAHSFHRKEFAAAAGRLSSYLGRAATADRMEEPATARALAGCVLRGVQCGAVDPEEVHAEIGIGIEELTSLAHRPGPPS
ncbi:DUF6986 family protein [Brevibacterium album]|uniref:DUF6986 family protein n=1 Tax=Brevibacterium album TaxID=417948 RepID=UPI0004174474|nr:aldolase/citrate lyase family protein [Brevibacterium album]